MIRFIANNLCNIRILPHHSFSWQLSNVKYLLRLQLDSPFVLQINEYSISIFAVHAEFDGTLKCTEQWNPRLFFI